MSIEPGPGSVPRIVIDTNLLVGHLFRPQASGPAGVLAAWRAGDLLVCTSEPVVREMRRTLGRLPVDDSRRRELLDLLDDGGRTELVDPVPDSGFRCADASDDKFLHLAIAARADALITSDRALHEVDGFPVPVMKSGQWLRGRGRCKQ